MVNRVDGIILGVGVVVLVASIIGVALYDEEGGQTFTISWQEADASTVSEQSDSGGPGEFTFDVPVNGSNIASVNFLVEVAANGQQVSDDSVSVEASGPGDLSAECSFSITAAGMGDGSNSCEATTDVLDRPESFTVDATNRSAAEAAALEQMDQDDGVGTWTVTVTVDGGTEVQDPSYSIDLTTDKVEWTPVAQSPSGPGTGPG